MATRVCVFLAAAVLVCALPCSVHAAAAPTGQQGSDATQYRPVICMHGLDGSPGDFNMVAAELKKAHPGQLVYQLDIYNGLDSWTAMWTQVHGVAELIRNITSAPDAAAEYVLVCHSQGGILCRAVLEYAGASELKIARFVSLAGVQLGVYGDKAFVPSWLVNITTDLAWAVFYTPLGQELFSAAGYWNDPYHHADFLANNTFLPVLNNQTTSANATMYRDHFLGLSDAWFFGSPQDGVVQPWNSELFGFWSAEEGRMVPMQEQAFYENDWFGLRTLDERGSLHLTKVLGVAHSGWLDRADIFTEYLEGILM